MTGTPCHNGPMNAAEPQGVRASARAELLREVGLVARAHLAESGAAGLSVRAIARELGLASSALYRYYPSRDDLLTRLIVDAIPIPVIASGGVGELDDLVEGLTTGGASAVLAASIFHYGEHTIDEAKAHLRSAGVPVRQPWSEA